MKSVAQVVGVILFWAPPIYFGVYAGETNPTSWIGKWGVGLFVGLGLLAVEGALLAIFEAIAKKKNKKDVPLILAIILVGALPFGYWIGLPWMATRPFDAHMAEYIDIASTQSLEQDVQSAGQPVNGRILPVNMEEKRIDPVFFELSRDLRPNNPDEVGAIAALWWTEVEVGTYGGMGSAYREDCTVMVWDKTTRNLLSQKWIMGPEPPSSSINGAGHHGDKPYNEVRDYLNGLTH